MTSIADKVHYLIQAAQVVTLGGLRGSRVSQDVAMHKRILVKHGLPAYTIDQARIYYLTQKTICLIKLGKVFSTIIDSQEVKFPTLAKAEVALCDAINNGTAKIYKR